jgi:hypothetical protein
MSSCSVGRAGSNAHNLGSGVVGVERDGGDRRVICSHDSASDRRYVDAKPALVEQRDRSGRANFDVQLIGHDFTLSL